MLEAAFVEPVHGALAGFAFEDAAEVDGVHAGGFGPVVEHDDLLQPFVGPSLGMEDAIHDLAPGHGLPTRAHGGAEMREDVAEPLQHGSVFDELAARRVGTQRGHHFFKVDDVFLARVPAFASGHGTLEQNVGFATLGDGE